MKMSSTAGSRRKFLQGLTGAAISTAAGSSLPSAGYASPQGPASTYDWVVVGSGIEGAVEAAIFGHDVGLKTVMIEKSALVGGGGSSRAFLCADESSDEASRHSGFAG